MKKKRLLIPVVVLLCLLGVGAGAWFLVLPQEETNSVTVSSEPVTESSQTAETTKTTQKEKQEKEAQPSVREEKKDAGNERTVSSIQTVPVDLASAPQRHVPATVQSEDDTPAVPLPQDDVTPAPDPSVEEEPAPVPPTPQPEPVPPTPHTEPEERPTEPILAPEITSVETTGGDLFAGRENSVRLYIKTKDIPSGTPVYTKLLSAEGEELSSVEVNLNNNEALVDLLFPASLTAGEYTVQVSVADLEKKLSYHVKEVEHPKLENVWLDRDSHIEGAEAQVRVSGQTKFIADQTAVKITVTDVDNASLEQPLQLSTQVQADTFSALLTLPKDLPEGTYQILIEVAGLVKAQPYRVEHRLKPEIRQLAVNSETIEDGQRKIRIKADTADIKDETPAQITVWSEDELLHSVSAAVKNNEVLATASLEEESLADGEYRVQLAIDDLVAENTFTIQRPLPPVEPKFVEVKADKEEGIELSEDELTLVVTTEGVSDMAEITAELQTLDGVALDPKVEVREKLYNQAATLHLKIADRYPKGDYQIKVAVAEHQLEMSLPYKLIHKPVPTLARLTVEPAEHVEQSEAEAKVTIETVDIENDEMILVELVDAQGESLPERVMTEAKVLDQVAEAALQIPAAIPYGEYQIRASYRTLRVEQPYRIIYLPKPEILEVKANKHAVSYGYADSIQIHLKLKDIPMDSEMKVVLRNEAQQPVEGYDEQLVKTVEDAWEHSYALSPLPAGKYFIHVELVGDETISTDIDLKVSDANAGWKEILDYSQKNDQLYWFDELNRAYAYTDPNSPFDPKKPTMIFIHGWQNGEVAQNRAPDFNYEFSVNGQEVRVNSAKAWIDAGYNVGVYNWVQIADEPGEGWTGSIPYSAEAKIWTTNYQYYKRPMRYRLNDGSFINESAKTAAELFVEKYLDAMKGYQGDYITFGGHSLGNQMALRATALIMDKVNQNQADRAIVPDQLTLFDPYYAGNTDRFAVYKNQSKTTAAKAGAAIATDLAKQNIVIDMYKSSDLTTSSLTGDANKALENVAAFNTIKADMFGFLQQAQKHSAAYQFYYWGKVSGNAFYIKNPAEIASLMGSYFRIEQSEGNQTVDPSDDKGTYKNRGTYVPVTDIILKDEQDQVLDRTAIDDPAVLTVAAGTYTRVKATVAPLNASSTVVVIEKAGGDLDAVQLAYDGYIKGVQPGTTLLKAIVVTRDAAGNKTGVIEKYFSVEVQ